MARKRSSDSDLGVSGAGAAAPVRRKSAARPRATRAAEPLEPVAFAVAGEEVVMPQADFIASAAPATEPTYDQIAALAYSYWEARGRQGGCPDEDWRRAEEELRTSSTSAATA